MWGFSAGERGWQGWKLISRTRQAARKFSENERLAPTASQCASST
jgi:hypothetical protein